MLIKKTWAISIYLVVTSILQSQNYLVVTHNQLYDNTWYLPFEALKSSQGYNLFIATIDDGADTTNIKNLITSYNPIPDYVLLVGDANEEPFSQAGQANVSNGNYIPFNYIMMNDYIHQPDLVPIANDDYYINSLPQSTVIGRLPAESSDEISVWVNKLIQYSNQFATYSEYKNKILLVTDNIDHPSNGCRGIYRNNERDSLITRYLLPSAHSYSTLNSVDFVASSDQENYYLNREQRAIAFENALNNGYSLVNAMGDGADWTMLVNFYYTYPNIESPWQFTNINKYPFLLGFSCNVGQIQKEISGEEIDTIIEKLLFFADGGVIGTIAPTWNTTTMAVNIWNDMFFKEIVENGERSLAHLLKSTKPIFNDTFILHDWQPLSYQIYGDPSMPLALYQYKSNNVTENTTWQGSLIVENDITIAPGATLTIKPGTGVFFKNNTKLIVEGVLKAEGTEDFPIKFSAASENPSMSDWYGLRFNETDNSKLKHCIVEYARFGNYGWKSSPGIDRCEFRHNEYSVYLLYSSPKITNSELHHSSRGLYVYGNQSEPFISNNKIHHNTFGLVCNSSPTPYLEFNAIHANDYGAYLSWYSTPEFGPTSGSDGGYNTISASNTDALYVTNKAQPFLGSSYRGVRVRGLNNIENSGQYHVNATNEAKVMAEYNWWGADPPDPGMFNADGVSTIDYDPYLSRPARSRSLASRHQERNPGAEDFGHITFNRNTSSVDSLWTEALEAWFTGRPGPAVAIMKWIVRNYSDTDIATEALVRLISLSDQNRIPGLLGFLQSLLANPAIDSNIKSMAMTNIIGEQIARDQTTEAETFAQQIVSDYPNTDLQYLTLYQLFTIYYYEFNATESAESVVEQLVLAYPNRRLTLLAQFEMGQGNNRSSSSPTILTGNSNDRANVIPDTYKLYQNYPNPFNPATTIAFDLPETEVVNVAVYNMLGQKVTELVNRKMDAGRYNLRWEANDRQGQPVSAGVYLVHLQAGDFQQVRKAVLLK